jgi:hypothetical protein
MSSGKSVTLYSNLDIVCTITLEGGVKVMFTGENSNRFLYRSLTGTANKKVSCQTSGVTEFQEYTSGVLLNTYKTTQPTICGNEMIVISPAGSSLSF